MRFDQLRTKPDQPLNLGALLIRIDMHVKAPDS